MTYTKQTWVNGEDGGTPITAEALGHIEDGIAAALPASAAAPVATSGAYPDLTGRPTLAAVATSGAYGDLSGRPALATVATTGSYPDLTNRPGLAAVATSGSYTDLNDRPALATVATTGAYGDLSGRPTITTYTDEQAVDAVAAALVAGSGISKTYDDAGNTLTLAVTASGSDTTGDFGAVLLDSFTGASDDAKLTAALTAVAADTYKRTILLTNRQYVFATANRAAFSGLRIQGPAGYSNPEKGNAFMPGRVALSGTGPWFDNNGATVFDVSLRNLSFTGGSSAYVLGQSGAGQFYCLHMRDIFASGLSSVLGSQASALLITAAHFDGAWEINNSYHGAFHLGGSDNRLWTNGGLVDSDTAFLTAGGSNGQAHLWCDSLENTLIGPLYITAEGGWTGIKVDGPSATSTSSNQATLVFSGLQVEGRNAGAPSTGALIRVNGGHVRIRDAGIHYGMSSPGSNGRTDSGVIHHAGGNLLVDGVTYDRATGVAQTVPFVYTNSTGDCSVRSVMRIYRGGTWTARPVVARATAAAENRITDATVALTTV